jgi:hypothetical protein
VPSDPESQKQLSRGRDSGDKQAGHSQSRLRRYWRWIFGVVAAFGVLGAIGSQVVNWSVSTAGEKIRPDKTLLIGVREDPRGGSDGFHVAARSAAGLDAKLRDARDCDTLMTKAKAAGAADVERLTARLTLEGGTRHDVSIVDMRARIRKREPTFGGASILCASAGAVGGIGILFDLDDQHPVALKLTDGDALTTAGPYFAGGDIINLAKSETLGFEVVGTSTRNYVEWEIQADVIIDGKERTVTIDNHGQPFRVTGARNREGGYHRYYEYRWNETPPHMYMASTPPAP